MPPTLPEVIGKYRVERFIESGGMGDVYLARDPTLDRPVAIKFLREGFDSEEMRERFEREARSAGRLSHPNIVTIYEFGEFLRRPFIAMEFVRGEPLSKLIKRREPIPLVRKLEMMEGLCSGLGHAHKAGIVHRDIKPANLMVDADGPLKILDFGIVRMAGSGLTFSGVLVGTVNYMSPEQIAGSSAIDHRSDVFAVGSVLYEIFTNQRAFPGEMADVLYKIVHTQPLSPAALNPELDPAIVRAIEQCLDKAPDRRYQDLAVLRRDLARIRQRYELDDQETYGHSGPPGRPPGGTPPSHPGVPSGTTRPASASAAQELERQRQIADSDRLRIQQAERARLAREHAEQEERIRIARERAETAERERIAQEQAAKAERERVAREQAAKAERERLARERAEQAERERIAREQAEKAERERLAREQAAKADRERLAREQAEKAERERIARERAEKAERERIAREHAEKAERERTAREQAEKAERERIARERAEKAERERIAREQAEQAERERIAREQAEQAERDRIARDKAALAERDRVAREQAAEAERARVAREQAEQARLEEARQAREEAERKRAEEQRLAKLEAERQAALRRQQRQQAVADARQLVASGRFDDAVRQLRPWTGESAGDAAFASLLAEAEAGVQRLEAERREQEALARHVSSAAELLVRQDLEGAARIVRQLLASHPEHPGARTLEREIARAVELRARAAAVVDRAQAGFDADPGSALESLERFTPPHALVDAALAELRARLAAREKERRRREAQERRRAAFGAIAARAGDLPRNRAVQGVAAVLLVAVIGFASYQALRSRTVDTPPPAGPTTSGNPEGTGKGTSGEPDAKPQTPEPEPHVPPTTGVDTSATPTGSAQTGTKTPVPAGQRNTVPPRSTTENSASAANRTTVPATGVDETPDKPTAGKPTPGPDDTATPPTNPNPSPAQPTGTVPSSEQAPKPTPEPPPPTVREVPAAPNPVAVATQEIRRWMTEYQAAYQALDARRVREMNRQATLSAQLLESASVQFSNVEIHVQPDGQRAALNADIRYDYKWKRAGGQPTSTSRISWPMRRVGSSWVAN